MKEPMTIKDTKQGGQALDWKLVCRYQLLMIHSGADTETLEL